MLNGLGAVDDSLGKYEEAKGYHQEALSIAETIGYVKGKADTFNGLGCVSHIALRCRGTGNREQRLRDGEGTSPYPINQERQQEE